MSVPGQAGPTTAAVDQIRAALNLGWSMAELRGRIRYGHVEPPGTVDYQFPREEYHALPIGGEHSLVEQQIATRVAVGLLAERFSVNDPLPQRNEAPPDTIKKLAMDLEQKLEAAEKNSAPVRPDAYPPGSEVAKAWEAASEAIYYWDEQIQDGLGVSAELLAAYQLGRGLAEAFWALDPDAPEPDSRADPCVDGVATSSRQLGVPPRAAPPADAWRLSGVARRGVRTR